MSNKSTQVATAPAQTPAQAATPLQQRSLVATFATKLGVEPGKMLNTLKATAFKQPKGKDGGAAPEVTDEQMMALLIVANEYHLNPFTKEIYAFPAKGGGIVPIVSIDGWIRIINERPELKAIEFEEAPDGCEDPWIRCTITRSDRIAPISVREFLSECYRETDAWKMKRRMLRHRSLIQCARVAFGYGGIYDPDEGERVRDAMAIDGTATEVHGKPATRAPQPKLAAPVPAATAAPAAAPAPTDDELAQQIHALLNSTGVPESELCAHFEIGVLDEMQVADYPKAIEYLKGVNAG